MSKIGKVVPIEIPDKQDKKLNCIKIGGKPISVDTPYYPPLKDLEEWRLPKDTFQYSNKTKSK